MYICIYRCKKNLSRYFQIDTFSDSGRARARTNGVCTYAYNGRLATLFPPSPLYFFYLTNEKFSSFLPAARAEFFSAAVRVLQRAAGKRVIIFGAS